MPFEPRYAVFFKAYAWDAFIERQARRCLSRVGRGDFFVSLDETNGPIGPIPFPRVVQTSTDSLLRTGFANRTERGALLWWNADYPHYPLLDLYPGYDYYVFQEYDVTFTGPFDTLIDGLAATGADFAALPVREQKREWAWTKPHLATYSFEQIEGCLMSLSVFSRRALGLLAGRRLAMSQDSGIAYWPSAEVFLPTEIKSAGYVSVSLERFADTSRFAWRPPSLEEEVASARGTALFHPVYDHERFVRWALAQAGGLSDFFKPGSSALRALGRTPLPYRLRGYFAGLWRSLREALGKRLTRDTTTPR